jgi:hypothetical protein
MTGKADFTPEEWELAHPACLTHARAEFKRSGGTASLLDSDAEVGG